MNEAAQRAETIARLTPLAKQIITKLGWEVQSYGMVRTPVPHPFPSATSGPETIYLSVNHINSLCYLIAATVLDTQIHG